LATARKSGADDLKLISGVGPKLEGVLNTLGFWHFDQISKWTDAEIVWVDSQLTFKGRIVRDNWVDQATRLLKS
jgi:NADH-quinone oxidoreductase subunit E